MLAVDNLVTGYGVLRVVKGVSLGVRAGEAVALVGSNGAGKTTTLRALCGVIPVVSGEVKLDGHSLKGLGTAAIARAGLVMVPEGRQVFQSLTVYENLTVGLWARKRSRERPNLESIWELFPRLWERRRQKAGTLSGGEQQMLALARALVAEPRLLLMDEPSMGLAPKVIDQVYEVIRSIVSIQTGVLLVEQNVSLALDVCARAYVMENGFISLEGSCQQLKSDARVRDSYLGR